MGAEFVLDTPVVRSFVADVQAMIAAALTTEEACEAIRPRFADLLADPQWLPERYQAGAPESGMGGGIGQWLLYRGTQDEEIYAGGDGALQLVERRSLAPGDFYVLIPPRDDIHRVRTTSAETSVSIHLLTNDTGCVWRHAYDPRSGEARPFRSGYVNVPCEDDATP